MNISFSKLNKTFIFACAFFILITLFVIGCEKVKVDTNDETDINEVILTLAVVSDVHIGKGNTRPEVKFESALLQLPSLAADLDAIAFVGDLVDKGTDKEYEEFNRILNENLDSSIKRIYCMGNHEYFRDGVVRYGGESAAFLEECQQAYMDNTDGVLDSVHVINGIHIISISARNSAADYIACEEFLIKSVKEAAKADPKMPIIIIGHQGAGSFFAGGSSGYTQATIDTLNKYPQIIFFSGHTHKALQDNRMIQQENYTTVQTSTLGADFWNYSMEEESQPPNADSASQGLILRVMKNGKSQITRYDFAHEAVIGSVWKVDPNNFTHTISQNKKLAKEPEFPYGSSMQADVSIGKVTLTFDAATINDEVSDGLVYRYYIRVTNKATNKIVFNSSLLSDYYMGRAAKDSFNYVVRGLEEGDYTASVYASSLYEKRSQSLKVDFTIID